MIFAHTRYCETYQTFSIQQEKLAVQNEIRITKPPSIRPAHDENAFIQKLVAQFLSHDGYVETAQAFAQEVRNETMALQNNQAPSVEVCDVEEDINAINRQSKTPLKKESIVLQFNTLTFHHRNPQGDIGR